MTTPVVLMMVLGAATVIGGVVSAFALWIDKRRARQGRRRVPERTLHTIELCGGWLGSLMARGVLRHKTRKGSYRMVAAGIGVVHGVAWMMLIAWALGWLG